MCRSSDCNALLDCIDIMDPKDCCCSCFPPPSNGNDSVDICNGFRKNGLELFLVSVGRSEDAGLLLLLLLLSMSEEPMDADLLRRVILVSSMMLASLRALRILLSLDEDP